jgi:integrase/recombinase XerD
MVKPKRGIVGGPLAPYASGFWEELVIQGYAVRSAETHLLLMARLSRWLEVHSLDPVELNSDRLDQFMVWNHARTARFPKSTDGLQPLVGFLRRLGVVPAPVEPAVSADEALLERFGTYLTRERGLAAGTVGNYMHAGRVFLRALHQAEVEDIGCMSAADVNAFVVGECPKRSIAAAKNLVNGLRALLRFLHVEGITVSSLTGAVPTVSGWCGGGLPRGIDAGSVKALLASCDRRTAKGRRDFAVLTILSRLGLRAGEVVGLDLDDVDWTKGEILVRGKANRLERLPLPADVGQAVAGYLKRGRPKSEERALFLRTLAPHRRIMAGSINVLMKAASDRAGLSPIAPHRLRHTVGSELLRHGAGLSEIGQVLRHRSAASTARYSKVDTESLRQLARSWPGVPA